MKTLNILQAAELLGAHKETVRRMAASKQIPGVKIGRSWIFIEHDLVMHIRNKYSTCDASQRANHRSNKKSHSPKEMEFAGLISGTKEKEYAKVLGLK